MSETISTHDRNQLRPSIEKLFHYLAIYVNQKTKVTVFSDEHGKGRIVYEHDYVPASSISISPTLYTRLDDCHGAGNCCRVPFDLVYTVYDFERIVRYDHQKAANTFGEESAKRFDDNRVALLGSLQKLQVKISRLGVDTYSHIYVQRNTEVFGLSGNKSCPYLFIGGDRYFCGIHVFKPLHCWYPHMVVRVNEYDNGEPPTILIGRMQYGRNHKFGCPVIFENSSSTKGKAGEGLFETIGTQGKFYLDKQFEDDIEKLSWTSKSAASLGFDSNDNFVVGIDEQLRSHRESIRSCLEFENHVQIPLKRR